MLSFRTDSELVNRAVEKEFVKNRLYAPLLEKALNLSKQFDLFFMKWIPSAENKVADEFARQAISKKQNVEKNDIMKKPIFADISLLLVTIIWGSTFVLVQNAIDFLNHFRLMEFDFLLLLYY